MENTERYLWETDFQFQARKAFTETHRQKYDSVRLAALSSAWANWKFHGCIYCKPVQDLLQKLDLEVPESLNAAVKRAVSSSRPKKIEFQKQSNQGKSGPALVNGFIIYEPSKSCDSDLNQSGLNSISILHNSAQKSRKTIEFQDLGGSVDGGKIPSYSIALFIDGKLIVTGKASSKKLSKQDCADKALEILRKSQPVVYRQLPNHENVTKVEKNQLTDEQYKNSKKIDDSNIGNQMLRKMGWTGDGGLKKGGIADPVFLESSDGRKGFGHENDSRKIQKSSVEDVLLAFIRDQRENEIQFSSDLSKSERELVHKLSQKFGLGHKSFGTGDDRYIVVTRKTQSDQSWDSYFSRTQGSGSRQNPIWL